MRRSLVFAIAITLYSAVAVQAQVGTPGIQYTDTVAGGDGVQLYPYDQQDPWLHGYFQRYPAYGGFSSFRPYNYRHVFAQTQLAGTWGLPHGMPYSQQFWNKYRGSYLDQNLHSQATPMLIPQGAPAQYAMPQYPIPQMAVPGSYPAYPASQPMMNRPMPVYSAGNIRSIGYQSVVNQVVPNTSTSERLDATGRPIPVQSNR